MFHLYPVATRLASRAGLTGQCNVRRRYTLSEKQEIWSRAFLCPGSKGEDEMRKKKYGYGLGQGIFGQRIRLTRSPRLHPQFPAHVTVVWGSQKHT